VSKKVFIIADIGLDVNKGYHVGDEAMFCCNLHIYLNNHFDVTASSRSISHNRNNFTEVTDIYIKNKLFFLWLLTCSVLLKYFRINLFQGEFRTTVTELIGSDLLHISGGGNINSFWPGHIYFRCLMIYLADLFNIPIIMTSQTIGPLNQIFHEIIIGWALNKVKFIGVRDAVFSKKYLEKSGVTDPLVDLMTDDALQTDTLGLVSNDWLNTILANTDGQINIGLSLHDWQNISHYELITKGLVNISKKYPNAKFFAIPHLIDNNDEGDTGLMSKLLSESSIEKFYSFSYKDIIKISKDIESIPLLIFYITAQMDIVISSRYHGLVFSSVASVPAIAINYDEYYRAKNEGFLSFYYDKIFSIGSNSTLLNIFSHVLLNKDNIIKNLKQKNLTLKRKNKYYLQHIIKQYIK
jgi:hypothetical protein